MEEDLGWNPGSSTYYLCDYQLVPEPHFSDLGNIIGWWGYTAYFRGCWESVGAFGVHWLTPESLYSPADCNHMAQGGLLFYKIKQSKLVTLDLLS